MSNSPLVEITKISPNSSPRSMKIDRITIHHMAVVASAEACGAGFQPKSREASSNYGIGKDGEVGLYVDESRRAWTSGNRINDDRAVTIEVSNSAKGGNWPVSDKVYAKLIDLCVDICQRNGIKKLNYTGDTSGNLTMHKWFANTACPGPYLEERFPDIAAKVNARLGASTEVKQEAAPKVEVQKVSQLPELSYGCEGDTVRALQILLEGNDCSCGECGADGDFGSATRAAVVAYQLDNGLDADGIVGPKTWARLLGLG